MINKDELKLLCDLSRLSLSDEELERRRANWRPRQPKITTGYLSRYAKLVSSGVQGAVLD